MSINAEQLDQLEDTIAEVTEEINAVVRAGNGAHDPVEEINQDPGPESIMHASELSSEALRQAYEECANRVLQLAKANLDRAIEDTKRAEQFAHAIRSHGRLMAERLEAGFARASTMAAAISSSHALIDKT